MNSYASVPENKTKTGDQAFRVDGPWAWNGLPAPIKEVKPFCVQTPVKMRLFVIHVPEFGLTVDSFVKHARSSWLSYDVTAIVVIYN